MNTNELLKIVAEMREWTWLPDRTPSVVMRDWADRLERLSASEATGGEPVAFVEYRLLGRARVEWLAPIPEPGTKLYAAPPALPDGFVVVPVEPTSEMCIKGGIAGSDEWHESAHTWVDVVAAAYKAMLAAAPKVRR